MLESSVCSIPGALEFLHARYFAPVPNDAPKPKAKQKEPSLADDAALIEKAGKAKNGAKFQALMAGDCSSYPSQSEADVALCMLLAFWTQDPAQIDRIFRSSGLFRDKWDKKHHADGNTYGQGTIQKALDGVQSTYRPSNRKPPASNGEGQRQTQQGNKGRNDTVTPPSQTIIKLIDGELPRIVGECQDTLISAVCPIFQRVNSLVRPLVIEKDRQSMGLKLEAGTLLLEPVTEGWLVHELTKATTFEKFDKREGEWLRKDCPPRVAKTLLDISGQWRFPYLAGTIEAPTLRPDGSLLNKHGYDPDTGLYLHMPQSLKVKVRDKPTRDHAWAALLILLDLLRDFPFIETEGRHVGPDCAVALAAILTGLIRRLLRTAPGFLFTAPTAGSGKTLLANVVSLICTGRPAPTMSQGANDEELEKRIGGFLLQGLGILNIDNIERALGGELLCSLLTEPEVTIRILGESRSPSLPTNFLFMATGNNADVKGDMRRRMLLCGLDPKSENPDKRTFDVNLYDYVPAHRGELIAAGLTILRAYHCAGRPNQGVEPYGSFGEWSDWVRSALVWLDCADPCLTRTRLEVNDPETAKLAAWSRLPSVLHYAAWGIPNSIN
ncbi:MAG: hypothetical protein NTX45_19390 [Proteobacteria bacterium]|nr:hypothetical protein [Pseudomonadota bacterium]